MRVKNSFLFQFSQCIRPMIIFYSVILAITTLSCISIFAYESDVSTVMTVSGWDFAGLIFLFVTGCVTTSEGFPVHLQNSISRKSYFIGKILSVSAISAIMTIMYTFVFQLLLETVFFGSKVFQVESILHLFYFETDEPTIISTLWSSAVLFVLSLFITMLGVFFSGIFYRVGTITKVTIAAGIPLLFLVVLPIIDSAFLEGTLYYKIFDFFANILGVFEQLPWKGCLSFGVLFIVTTLLSWLVYRRMPMKR
ncbi:MAG: hypothetical protein J1E56_05040 [Ruminococcus sp.]|nr:hypothetical protein [Ruminococcus sp.]